MNGLPYLGKGSIVVGNETIPEYSFRVVTTPIHGTNRTVACDNWFMSIPLVQNMARPPYNMTMTGTLRKNKRQIPADMKVASKKPPFAKFCHTSDLTLVFYTPKKNKLVILLSSYEHSTESTDNKPNVIHHYNKTKGGTDCFDQLCHAYSVTRRTTRWPVRIFYGMLDQAIVNARILFACKLRATNNDAKNTAISCLEKIASHLMEPHLRKRYEVQTLRRDLKISIAGILGIDNTEQNRRFRRVKFPRRIRCSQCARKSDKKTNEGCANCKRAICKTHRFIFCKTCIGL